MKYPTGPKTCKQYAEYLAFVHNKKFLPIVRKNKIKNKFSINFAAVYEEELPHYLVDGWEVIK